MIGKEPSNLTVTFLATFVAVCAGALLLAAFVPQTREVETILLFIPLIWAYLALSLKGIGVCVAIISAVRASMEAIHAWRRLGYVLPLQMTLNVVPVILLYVVLAAVIWFYRRTQRRLTDQLLVSKAREVRAQVTRGLSHDFNNVLSVVAGTAQVLSRNKSLDAQAKADVRNIVEASQQGMSLVSQMRGVSMALAAGPAEVDLSDLVERHMLVIERVLPPGIRTVRSYCALPLPVLADVGQMLRLLMNLSLNARDAMPDGGCLTVRTERRDDRAVLILSDSGTGIEPRNLPRIFDPFFTTRGRSAGLGLTIVRSIVENHNGTIEVQSHLGEGTTFTIKLPLRQAPAGEQD